MNWRGSGMRCWWRSVT